ncbi:long-chain fatty acid--CoA ligase [Mycolicibacterium fluoranthenivorans]|uniref:Long-chain fatty acid--CoA ligase n=1 Tax=Mycolicibacterium fluoranthenivorans TaxID=258505 RepID=A0A7G8PQ15_9MYCO|nr:long-chain fatty acid--CoA ligase [Mycolicibacterium fluoranthenivorans]
MVANAHNTAHNIATDRRTRVPPWFIDIRPPNPIGDTSGPVYTERVGVGVGFSRDRYRGHVTESFTETFAARVTGYADRPCIEFGGHWYTGTEVTAMAAAVEAALGSAGVPAGAPIGLVVRNRWPHAAAIIGLLAAHRWVSMIYSFQSPTAIAADIEKLRLPAVLADDEDWTAPVVAAAAAAGSAGVRISVSGAHLVDGLARSHVDTAAGRCGVHVLTSGTTGPPKRQAIAARVLERAVYSVTGGQARADDPPELVYWPLGGIGGVCQLITGAYIGKRMVLLEKFSVQEWVRVVKTYRLQRAGVQPTVVRMLLEADLDPVDLASLRFIVSASGPLDPEVRDAFERRYRIPVLLAYGATEFAGSVCAWTPELYREFGATKRLSSGKALPDTEVRIIDADTGEQLEAGRHGLLEARIASINPDWIRTTDIASIDSDGFITLHARADGAINRGGFKILPETVRRVLLDHPGVRDACVVGVPDARLGQVPFAAVELIPDVPAPDPAALLDLVRETLPHHSVPVRVVVVDALPRNPALKVSLRDVAALYRP